MIGLRICTAKIGIICDSVLLSNQVAYHFQGFVEDVVPDYVVRIMWTAKESNHWIDQVADHNIFIDKKDGRYIFASSQYTGILDHYSREAELSVLSSNPISDIEYFLRIVLSFCLYDAGGFLLHSAGIIRNNKAFVYFGKSGSGKSTVAQLSTGDVILSDDLVGIIPEDQRVYAYSTPFWNPGWPRCQSREAEISGFFRLCQDHRVYVSLMKSSLAISEMLSSIPVIPTLPKIAPGLISIVQTVVARTGVRYLHFRRDGSFWDIVEHQGGIQ